MADTFGCSNLVDLTTYQTFTSRSILSDLLAWISPELRGKILNCVVEKKKQNTSAHLFHIFKTSFDSLRSGLKTHLDNKQVDVLSYNNLVLALVTKTLAQAQKLVGYSKEGGYLPLFVIFETREQLGVKTSEYIGNILVPRITHPPLGILESPTTFKSLVEAISLYSGVVSSLTPSVVAKHVSIVNADPSCFTRPIVEFAKSPASTSFIYHTLPNMHEADFGYGKPAWISPIKLFRSNAVVLMPCKDADNGIVVDLTAYPAAIDGIFKNEFWNDIAKLVY